MARFIASLLILATFLVAPLASSAATISVIDQQSLVETGSLGMGTLTFGQSFTPTLTQIDAAEIAMHSGGLATTWKLDILEGATLAGTSLGSSLPVVSSNSASAFVHYDLVSPVTLIPGNLYTLRLSNVSGANISARGTSSDPYPGGTALLPFASVIDEIAFSEGKHVPEPSTFALAAFAALAAFGWRRRKR